MTRSVRWSVAASLAALASVAHPSSADDATPPAASPSAELSVTVKTEFVAYPRPGDPPPAKDAEPRAMQVPTTVELFAGPPDGAALPADAGAPFHGVLETNGKKTTVAALRGAGDALTVLVDSDRDGKLDPAKESYPATVATKKPGAPAGPGTNWRCEEVRLGDQSVRMLLAEMPAERPVAFGGSVAMPNPKARRPEMRGLSLVESKPPELTIALELPGKVRYASVKFGETPVVVALGRGEGSAMTLLVDTKPDFSTATKVEVFPFPILRGTRAIGTRWTSKSTTLGDLKDLKFNLFEHQAVLMAQFTAQGSRRGTADVAGKAHTLYLIDGDLDGKYESPEDSWWFGEKGENKNPNVNNMFEADAPCLLDGGLVWRLASVAADGTATIKRSLDADAASSTLGRRAERVNAKRWFPNFTADKGFAFDRELDASRPLAKEPTAFHFTRTMDEARAFAAKEGKPLLVDFEADWCIWCKRLDFNTYPDAVVAERMKKFAAVKMNTELDPGKTTKTLDWPGIPAVGVFRPDGAPLIFQMPPLDPEKPAPIVDHIPGWLKPEEFVKTLDAALAAYEDVKAGKPPLVLPPKPTKAQPTAPAPKEPAAPAAPDAPRTPQPPTAPPTPPDAPKPPGAPTEPK